MSAPSEKSTGSSATLSRRRRAKLQKARHPKPNLSMRAVEGVAARGTTSKRNADIIDLTIDLSDGEAFTVNGPSRDRGTSMADATPGSTSRSSHFAPSRSLLAGMDMSSVKAEAGPSRSRPTSPPHHSSTHFRPPPLFSHALPVEPDASSTRSDPSGLLLPGHIQLDTSPISTTKDSENTGVHFVDDDSARGVPRYFDDPTATEADRTAGKVCSNCHEPGHESRKCPHTVVRGKLCAYASLHQCAACGKVDEHERKDCPITLVCFGCGERGHRRAECKAPRSKMGSRNGCGLCGSADHVPGVRLSTMRRHLLMRKMCPSVWRTYRYRTAEGVQAELEVRAAAVEWEKEAVGGGSDEMWCYNCAREGHFGDVSWPSYLDTTSYTSGVFLMRQDCPSRRGSFARLMTSSAFSYSIASSSPFAARPGTHTLFTDNDVPYTSSYDTFPGSHPGAKASSRNKARQRQLEVVETRDDWFDTPTSRMQRGGRGGMPFSHGHLMSPRNAGSPRPGISFGKLGTPAGLPARPPGPGGGGHKAPQGGSVSKKRGKADTVIEGSGGSESVNGKDSRRKRKNRTERKSAQKDWETEWRGSGRGGGNVQSWGREMGLDQDPPPAESTRGRRGHGQGGQRYHGGY